MRIFYFTRYKIIYLGGFFMEIYVVGLGHIGLPLACWIALKKYKVNGYDINKKTIEKIKNGSIEIEENYKGTHISDISRDLVEKEYLNVFSDFKRVNSDPSIFVLVVGIANSSDGTQDITPLKSALATISPHLIDGDLILVRTTLIPGTCETLIKPVLDSLDASVGLAYCPETLMETKAFYELENNPMILAGDSEKSYLKAENFIRSLTSATINKASSIRAAEMTKVIQNIHRDVNIALSNELSVAANLLNLDIFELQKLVNTHPRVELLTPGPGVGGYCLPNAYEYLKYALNSGTGSEVPLIKLARNLNQERPSQVVDQLISIAKSKDIALSDLKVSVIGLAMKDFCADYRFSPALDIIERLKSLGVPVKSYDPITHTTSDTQVETLELCIENSNCIILSAIQEGLIDELVALGKSTKLPKVILDTRNALNDIDSISSYSI